MGITVEAAATLASVVTSAVVTTVAAGVGSTVAASVAGAGAGSAGGGAGASASGAGSGGAIMLLGQVLITAYYEHAAGPGTNYCSLLSTHPLTTHRSPLTTHRLLRLYLLWPGAIDGAHLVLLTTHC